MTRTLMKRNRTYPRPEALENARNSRVYKDGFVTLSLRSVLEILELRVIYTVDDFTIISRETGAFFVCEKSASAGMMTPWDWLRARSLLDPETFEPLALRRIDESPRLAA